MSCPPPCALADSSASHSAAGHVEKFYQSSYVHMIFDHIAWFMFEVCNPHQRVHSVFSSPTCATHPQYGFLRRFANWGSEHKNKWIKRHMLRSTAHGGVCSAEPRLRMQPWPLQVGAR